MTPTPRPDAALTPAELLREVADCVRKLPFEQYREIGLPIFNALYERAAEIESQRERATPVLPGDDPQRHAYTASLYKPGRCAFCGMDEGLHGPTAPPTAPSPSTGDKGAPYAQEEAPARQQQEQPRRRSWFAEKFPDLCPATFPADTVHKLCDAAHAQGYTEGQRGREVISFEIVRGWIDMVKNCAGLPPEPDSLPQMLLADMRRALTGGGA